MKTYKKINHPVSIIRRFLEPGPIVLVSSAWKGEMNIMTMGWHMMMMDEPPLVGCFIWDQNHSYEMIKKSKECVINIPTIEIAEKVVRIGNTSGRDINKFKEFKLCPLNGDKVKAPLIKECFASFECRLIDSTLIKKYSLFVFKVVKAHVAKTPKFPKTLHYRGEGLFMLSGPTVGKYRKWFKPEYL